MNSQACELNSVRLTAREREVLGWCGRGKSSWEIAHILGRSEATVNYHFCNIRRKFSVTTRNAALAQALAHGLIEL